MTRKVMAGARWQRHAGITVSVLACMIAMQARAQEAAQPAPADQAANSDGLDEIVVTAERRESTLQKTGLSVTVRDGAELTSQGRATLSQIIEDVPSVTFVPNNTWSTRAGSDMAGGNVAIRGVIAGGIPGNSTLAGPPPTALYTDGVYEGIGSSFDISRVEVLRGPQGTLYGRSATSGAVVFHTNDPNFDGFSGDLTGEYGSYGIRHYSGALNAPITDTLAVRVAGNYYAHDGFEPSQGRTETSSARIKLLWKPSADFSLLVGGALEYNKTQSVGVAGAFTTPGTIVYHPIYDNAGNAAWRANPNATGLKALADESSVLPGKNNFRQVWAEMNWNVGFATLTYLPSYREWYQDATVYGSGGPNDWVIQTMKVPNDSFLTQELRLSSNAGSPLIWQVGVMYYSNKVDLTKKSDYLQSGATSYSIDAHRKTTDLGFFGEATLPIGDTLRLTGGLRYDITKVRTDEVYSALASTAGVAVGGCQPTGTVACTYYSVSTATSPDGGPRTFRDLTFKARAEFDLSPRNMLYAMASSSFLPGDVQAFTAAAPAGSATPQVVKVAAYDEETLTAYEIGTKNRFFGNKLQINAAAFYYDYGGYQASVSLDPGNPASAVIANMPARMIGGEIEAEYRFTRHDTFSLNYSRNDARFTDVSPSRGLTGTAYANEYGVDSRIDKIWNVVPSSVSGSYNHVFETPGDSTLTAHVAGRWMAGHYLNNVATRVYNGGGYAWLYADDAAVGDFDLTWRSKNDRVSITAYVRNFTNERYLTAALLTSPTGGGYGYLSEPRTYGVVLSAHF